MRVCVVYDCLFPYTVGGAERWYRNLAERLAQEGHEVTYLTRRQWERGARPEVGAGVRVVTVAPNMALYTKSGRRRIVEAVVFGAGVAWHLARHGREYDTVHTCAFPYFSLLAAAVTRPRGRYRLVVDWHEVWSRAYWREYLGPAGGAVGHAVQRACVRTPQRAFCFSRLHARRLRAEGLRGEPTVLEGEYAGSLQTPTPRAAEPVVVWAGRLIPEKRAPLAVAAVALAGRRLAERGVAEPLRGEIYGDGPEREALRRAIAEHGGPDVASAPGFVEAGVLDAAVRRATCMLSTSSREGYGMVVVEAAAHAVPSVVVAGEDNAAVEMIEDGVNGVVAQSADPETVAQAIVRVHEAGAPLRESTARWFAQNAQRLSIESSLRTVVASYGDASARA